MKIDSNWKRKFIATGISVEDILTPNIPHGVLPVANCSKIKGNNENRMAIPRIFYQGKDAQRFMRFCEYFNIRYAILSDEYGLHFQDEQKPFYDRAPASVIDREKLAKIIKQLLIFHDYYGIIYYCPTPSRAWTYLDILLRCNISIKYVRQLRMTENEGFFCEEN